MISPPPRDPGRIKGRGLLKRRSNVEAPPFPPMPVWNDLVPTFTVQVGHNSICLVCLSVIGKNAAAHFNDDQPARSCHCPLRAILDQKDKTTKNIIDEANKAAEKLLIPYRSLCNAFETALEAAGRQGVSLGSSWILYPSFRLTFSRLVV